MIAMLCALTSVHHAEHEVRVEVVRLSPGQPQPLHDRGRVDERAVHVEQGGAGAESLGHASRVAAPPRSASSESTGHRLDLTRRAADASRVGATDSATAVARASATLRQIRETDALLTGAVALVVGFSWPS
jgi:hypothetical protein